MKPKSKFIISICFILYSSFFRHTSCSVNQDNSKWIVITSINHPTKAIKDLATLQGWHVVVVGDKKTPTDWHLENCEYLSPEKQEQLDFRITKL